MFKVLVVLMLSTSLGWAADCVTIQKRIVQSVEEYDRFTVKSNKQYAQCSFYGIDEKSVNNLTTELMAVSDFSDDESSALKECMGDHGNIMRLYLGSRSKAGESFGLMVGECTREGKKIWDDKKLTPEEKAVKFKEFLGRKYLK